MEVTLIRDPMYVVNFAKYLPKKAASVEQRTDQKVYQFGVAFIQFFGVVISSALQAGALTLRYSVSSFSKLVLDSLRISDFYFGAFKVAYWVFSLGFTFLATTIRNVIDVYSSSNELYLAQFASEGMDLWHIQTKGVKLDTSDVPETVKVDDLVTLFDEINFTNPASPGYMPPTTRVEGQTSYTVEDLKKSLKKFIADVNGRVAFLGTPPTHDTVRLNAFYQQIEDAVRLSIHKVTKDLDGFRKAHSGGFEGDADAVKKYKDLMEDQARLVIDLAIAGKHCGARYMGEAMSSYYNLHGEAEPSGTLEETLIELLAAKRNEVAQGEIQRYFGASTHGFSQYMQHMGDLLAIPGTENVIEHLSGAFDYTQYLRSFFEVYTEDCIIDAIQEKVKKSQAFREQVVDWLKGQVGEDWNPADLPSEKGISESLEKAKLEAVDTGKVVQDIQFLIEVLEFRSGAVHSCEQEVAFPNTDEGWSDFIAQLFALDEVKARFREINPKLGIMDLMRKRQALMHTLENGLLGKALKDQFKATASIVVDAPLVQLIQKLEQANNMKRVLPVATETLVRILEGEAQ